MPSKSISMAMLFFLTVMRGSSLLAAHCVNLTESSPDVELKTFTGHEVIAFASWCSSCKDKILATKDNPEKYILLSVFDESDDSQRVLTKMGITSPCIVAGELTKKLHIDGLPWSKKF